MSPPVEKISHCPACAMKLSGTEEECPYCGWKFDRSDNFQCPFCGELIPVSSERCPLCNIDLSGLSEKARSQSVDKIRDVLMTDLHEIESSDAAGKGEKEFSCPMCAALLDGHESKCPECGQFLIGESGLRCPICGTPVGKRRKKCPKCGAVLGNLGKEAMPMIPYVQEPLVELELEQPAPSSTRSCPVCEAVVPVELLRCPMCGASLVREKLAPEAVEPPRAPEIQEGEAVIVPQPEIAPEATVPPRERRLKPGKATTVDFGVKTSAFGLSNGVGQINGRGMVNGAGAVNGRAFVDGTGISNGLGPRAREVPTRRTSFLSRWQLLAVIVAIVVIIPAFVFLSYSSRIDRFSIDGKFADWEGATTYGTLIKSTAPSSNITEWAIAAQSSDLYLYFRTQAHMMSSADAESYYLFIDSDGSNATGYIVESIGADYMLRLTGWDDAVNSTSMSRYSSSSDQLDWNAWVSSGPLSYSTDGIRMEAMASMPTSLGNSARFILVSKDSTERGSVSYSAPLKGAVLLVEQVPSGEVALDGLVPKTESVAALTVRFTSEGGNGQVEQVNPVTVGASLASQISSFSLDKGQTKEIIVALDTSAATDGQLVSAEVSSSSIVSSYASVEVVGFGASAYVGSPPPLISIDGAFADWAGRLSVDQDSIPVTDASVDIDEVGNLSTSETSFFYISVEGEMCSGAFVPAMVVRPSGAGGGGGVVIPTRHTAEDVLRIFVDRDRSNSTGQWVALNSKQIGADRLIEVRGLFGKITSTKEFTYSTSGDWVEMTAMVNAAKDTSRMEIGVAATSLGGSVDIDFIVETTSWKGRSDLAIFDPSTVRASTRTWVVDSLTASAYATSMSYQRKLFYDGINYWSFFFNGANTVCKYSADEGKTWVYSGRVFTTPRVNETSIWYDASTSTVYAVGDTSLPSRNVSVRMGIVDAAAHTISWANKDANLTTSLNPLAGKNTYISKDPNGYLWVLATNWTQVKPLQHGLSAFRSRDVNSTSSWIDTGNILPFGMYENNSKGSIVPAGSGGDMWAIYAYEGYVCAKKYVGAWPADYDEVVIYKSDTSPANTDNSPPSVVVDGKGVVHVVYGTGRADKSKRSIPQIFYSHNNSNSILFTAGQNLDPSNDTLGIANYYPTISLDSSTGNLYAVWLQCDSNFVPRTVMGRKCVSGTWFDMTIEPQTSFMKQFMTSIYSVPGEYKICWQWTQNMTAPIEVIFDSTWIPELGDLALPLVGFMAIFAVYSQRSRSKDRLTR